MRGEKEEKRKDDKGGVEWSHTGKGWCVCVTVQQRGRTINVTNDGFIR